MLRKQLNFASDGFFCINKSVLSVYLPSKNSHSFNLPSFSCRSFSIPSHGKVSENTEQIVEVHEVFFFFSSFLDTFYTMEKNE